MDIKFKNLVEIETFAKMAEQYNGDVILTNGSIAIDGESVVAIVTMGVNKWIELHLGDEDTVDGRSFKNSIKQIGIKTKGM